MAAMGVPGEEQVVAVVGEPVEHAGLRGMQHTEPQVCAWIGPASDLVIAVAADVRDESGRWFSL